MRGRSPIWSVCFLALWLTSQMPLVTGLVVMLHGSHAATAMQVNDRVVLVLAHQSAESAPDHQHDDHIVSASIEENYLRRGTSDGKPLLPAAPLITARVLIAPVIDHGVAGAANLAVDHAPPLLALRTVVLTV